jgi:hypothetical protein
MTDHHLPQATAKGRTVGGPAGLYVCMQFLKTGQRPLIPENP